MKHILRGFLALLLLLAFSATGLAYTDTADLSESEQKALDALSSQNVIEGYPDGSFMPAKTVTRAEFAKMICVYGGYGELAEADVSFSDVKPEDWHYGWVSRAAKLGLLNGYPGGEYRPQNTITQQEIATVLVRLAGTDTTGFIWPADYNAAAQKAGYLTDIAFAGATEASRIIACQLLYNAKLTPLAQEGQLVRGIVSALDSGTVTIKDGKNISATYIVSSNQLPEKLILGSYLELEVADHAVQKVLESIIPKKSAAYWDIAIDGSSAIIDDKKYDISEAEIFVVEYSLNKAYSSATFVKGSIVDRDILSLGGRLAAEMGIIIEENGSSLKCAYLVNAAISVSGGRLDVVDGRYSSAKGSGIYLMGREAGLPTADSFSGALPDQGDFIHYTLRNGQITGITTMLSLSKIITATDRVLSNNLDEAPYAWAAADDGKPDTISSTFAALTPTVIGTGNGKRVLQLGASENSSTNYWLAEGCLIYQVNFTESKIEKCSRGDIEQGQKVLALVSKNYEICYLFCIVD